MHLSAITLAPISSLLSHKCGPINQENKTKIELELSRSRKITGSYRQWRTDIGTIVVGVVYYVPLKHTHIHSSKPLISYFGGKNCFDTYWFWKGNRLEGWRWPSKNAQATSCCLVSTVLGTTSQASSGQESPINVQRACSSGDQT